MKLGYLCLSFVLNAYLASGEVFTALVDLSNSFVNKNQLADDLLDFVRIRLIYTKTMTTLARRLVALSSEDQCNDSCVIDPLKSYLLIKKFDSKLNELADFMNQSKAQEVLGNIQRRYERLPDHDDMIGAADALLRLQVTYKIPTQNIANGVLHKNIFSNPLTARECFEIGLRSYQKNNFHFVQWMNEAYIRFDAGDKYLQKGPILDYLSFGYYKQGNFRQALALTNEWLKIDPYNERGLQNKEYFENMIAKSKMSNLMLRGDAESTKDVDEETTIEPLGNTREKEFSRYEALCRGENLHQDQNAHILTCRLYVPHPYFRIAPIKEELVFLDPRIVLYHDIISDSEIEEIKNLSIPRLKRATVQNSITGNLEFASYRISKSAWLRYDLAGITKKINDRIALMTGIDLQTAEELQVVNYGIGGQYEPHFDFARKQEINSFEPEIGNRVATLIYYMSDVEAGGDTVFTEIGAKVSPVKGSAAFWWNLLPSGDGDLSTRHAACPVLGGSKWVMNKWFHERGQELIRPCCLNRLSKTHHLKCTLPNNPTY